MSTDRFAFRAQYRRQRRRGLLVALALLLPGCALLQLSQRPVGPEGESAADQVRSALLPPIPPPPNAVELEIVFVDRPRSDPLLGNRLWDEIDTSGAVDFQRRDVVNKNAFVVGISAANPPNSLQTLLGLQPGISESPNNRMAWQRRPLPDGTEAEIQASIVHPECSVTLLSPDGAEERTYKNARFVFRVMARRVQNGWVQVDFLPEIHHGDQAMRHTAGEIGYTMRVSQKIEPLFGQRFSVNLNVGEMAVMTCSGDEPNSVGNRFFLRTSDGLEMQRLLVVRLADVAKAGAVYGK